MYAESLVDAPDYYSLTGSFDSSDETARPGGITFDDRGLDVPDYYSTSSSIGNTVSSGGSAVCSRPSNNVYDPRHYPAGPSGMLPPSHATLPRTTRRCSSPSGHYNRPSHHMPLSTVDTNGHYGIIRSSRVVTQHGYNADTIGEDILNYYGRKGL